jgi:acyl-coenzyme A synthetase/AMP-(fatty) acid ligase
MRHPAIASAAVAPVPDAIRGDEVFACLTLTEGGQNSPEPGPELAEEITRWALGQMAYYKVPGHIAFVPQLPLTATQKIQRAALKTLVAELMTDPATVSMAHLKKRQLA